MRWRFPTLGLTWTAGHEQRLHVKPADHERPRGKPGSWCVLHGPRVYLSRGSPLDLIAWRWPTWQVRPPGPWTLPHGSLSWGSPWGCLRWQLFSQSKIMKENSCRRTPSGGNPQERPWGESSLWVPTTMVASWNPKGGTLSTIVVTHRPGVFPLGLSPGYLLPGITFLFLLGRLFL